MPMLSGLFLMTCAVLAVGAGPADGQSDHDHRAAREAREQGQNLPVREIERRVLPHMRGAQYLGFNYDPPSGVYTLKFLRDGAVIWVDVDGRTGRITGRSR